MSGTEEFPALSIRNATVVTPDGSEILKDLSLEVGRGVHTAILGPNGSGKSTLIKLLTHELRPTTSRPGASVSVFGRNRWNVFDLRSLLGIVSADLSRTLTSGYPPLKAVDAVVSGHFGTRGLFAHQPVAPEQLDSAHRALYLCGAAHLTERSVPSLSTGETRRVLLARALAPEPPALLLDEPTTGLDLVARQAFLHTLEALARRGVTIILVTHHVEEVLPAIQRVVLLSGGRIAREGPKEQVLEDEWLSLAYGTHIRVRCLPGGYYGADVGPS